MKKAFPKRRWSPRSDTPSISMDLGEDEKKLRERRERFNRGGDVPSGRGIGGYGFVSRGEDDRLQKSDSERKKFFDSIVNEFMKYCNELDDLKEAIRALIEQDKDTEVVLLSGSIEKLNISDVRESLEPSSTTIESILSSLRKLREALLHIPPTEFTKIVFLFSIRISASIGHYQTYIPSITYLLEKAKFLLSAIEVCELATLLSLHLVHCNNHCASAIETYYKYEVNDINLLKTITSWSKMDFFTWIIIYNKETNGCKTSIMRMGLTKMIKHLIDCLTSAYFNLDKKYLEEFILPNGIDFGVLVEKYNCTWKQVDGMIILRERGRKQ